MCISLQLGGLGDLVFSRMLKDKVGTYDVPYQCASHAFIHCGLPNQRDSHTNVSVPVKFLIALFGKGSPCAIVKSCP